MGKYGWRRIAQQAGWQVLTRKNYYGVWFGLLVREGLAGAASGSTEDEVLEQLEAWWRAQVTA